MAGIIIFLILAVGYALCGDASGIEAIGKIILYIALFIGVGCIIVYAPWFILVVIVGIIFWAIISSKGNKSNSSNNINYSSSNNYNDYQHQSEDNEIPFVNYSNQTDFQRQLQENTKTPQQVEDENWLKEKENIINIVKSDYQFIKNKLLEKAELGEYFVIENKKKIIVETKCSYLTCCLDKNTQTTFEKQKSVEIAKHKVTFYIKKEKEYNFYLFQIKKLANKDNIIIDIVFISNHKKNNISLPYTYNCHNTLIETLTINLQSTIYY